MSSHSPSADRSLRLLLDKYLQSLLVDGFSHRTEVTRRSHLLRFVKWCEDCGAARVVEVNRTHIRAYQSYLFHYRKNDGTPLSRTAQNSTLSSISSWFSWLTREGHTLSNPVVGISRPDRERTLPRAILSLTDLEKVFSAIDLQKPLGLRNRALVEVLYSTAIRRAELAHLEIDDLDLGRGTLFVRSGKGNRDRIIPIGQRAISWVNQYLEQERPKLTSDGDERTLFLNSRGRPLRLDAISRLGRCLIESAGIDGSRLACHVYRHTTATLMLERGADIRFIQQLLGHEHLSTTQIYTRVSIQKLKEVHTKTHPGERNTTEEDSHESKD